jgi:hypothetical protein
MLRAVRGVRMTWTTGVLLASALGAALLAGCGDDGGGTGDPAASAPTASSTPEAPPAPPADDKQVVGERSALYWTTIDELSGPEPYDAAKLRAIATEDWAESVEPALRQLRAAGVVVTGRTTVVTRAVTVTGGRATVQACVDESTARRTRHGTPPAELSSPTVFYSTMVRELGVWKVDEVRTDNERC